MLMLHQESNECFASFGHIFTPIVLETRELSTISETVGLLCFETIWISAG